MGFITDLINKITNFRVKIGDKLNTLKSQIGQLNLLTTNDKASLVGAVNEVNNKQVNLVPYTGANKAVDLNTQKLTIGGDFEKNSTTFEKSYLSETIAGLKHFTRLTDVASFSRGNDITTQSDCIVIRLPIKVSTRWVMEVDIHSSKSNNIFGSAPTKLLISAYSENNVYRSVAAIYGTANVKSVSFCRDADNNTVIIIRPNDNYTRFGYGKVNIADFYHDVIYDSDLAVKSNYKVDAVLESSLTGLTTNGTITNKQFDRDSYLLDFRNFTNVPDFAQSADIFKKDESTNWTNKNQRWSGLVDKSADATYNKVMVLDADGKAGTKNAGDLGKNFANTDLEITENRKHTGSASVELAMPMIYSNANQRFSGLVGKTLDSTYNYILSMDDLGNIGKTLFLGKITNVNSIALHSTASTNGANCVAIGFNATSDSRSNAIGSFSNAKNVSTAIGANTISEGYASTSIGNDSKSIGDFSIAMGYYAESVSYASVVLGRAPLIREGQSKDTWVSTDDLFIIGNSQYADQKVNGLELIKNGLLKLPQVTNALIDNNNKAVVTKEYLDIRIPKPPTTGQYVLKSINGAVSWELG